jgi:leucyl aminopeptidase
MRTQSIDSAVLDIDSDAIVAGIFSDLRPGHLLRELDQALGGAVNRLIAREEIRGKLAEVTRIFPSQGLRTDEVVVVGRGDRDSFNPGAAWRAAAAAAKQLAGRRRRRVIFAWDDPGPDTAAAICGALVGCQGQDLYRAEKKLYAFEELLWHGASAASITQGTVLGECVNLTRRLVNEGPSYLTPARFAEEALEVAQQTGLELEVWDEQRLAIERCGALLAVARGSDHPPRVVILRYPGGDPQTPPLALLGKGVTFDSGGYSLKPTEAMQTMKCDMSGAATVLGTLAAAARLQLPVNVTGYLGLVENLISGDAFKLGDVLTARSGTTIEVLNTDAEGRLVLADLLDVAVEQGAGRLIDLATLTGACVVALGTDVTGLMTNDQTWCDALIAAAHRSGEPVWQLPMFEEFAEQIDSQVADIKNIGEGRWGGAITAAKFLERFVRNTPWIHADIAGPAFAEKPKAWLDAGGTGVMIRTLVELLRAAGEPENV